MGRKVFEPCAPFGFIILYTTIPISSDRMVDESFMTLFDLSNLRGIIPVADSRMSATAFIESVTGAPQETTGVITCTMLKDHETQPPRQASVIYAYLPRDSADLDEAKGVGANLHIGVTLPDNANLVLPGVAPTAIGMAFENVGNSSDVTHSVTLDSKVFEATSWNFGGAVSLVPLTGQGVAFWILYVTEKEDDELNLEFCTVDAFKLEGGSSEGYDNQSVTELRNKVRKQQPNQETVHPDYVKLKK